LRREVVTEFGRFVEQYGPGPKLGEWVNPLPLNKRKVLTGLAQKKALKLRRLEVSRAAATQGLTVGPGEVALSFWLTVRQDGPGQADTEQREEVCRAVLPSARAGLVEYWLPQTKFPANRKLEAWLLAAEVVVLPDVPPGQLEALLDSY